MDTWKNSYVNCGYDGKHKKSEPLDFADYSKWGPIQENYFVFHLILAFVCNCV